MKKHKNPPPSEGKRVAIYLRKSDLTTESRGKSVAQQLEHCLRASKALSLEVSERLVFREEDGQKGWYHFEDLEGHNPPPFRPELTRLVREVEAGNVDIVMCWRSDRVYRDEIVAALFLRKLIAHGVSFYSQTQNMYIHTASGYQSALVEATSNKASSDKVGEDVARHLATNAANGLLTRDPSCLGFRSAGKGTGVAVPVHDELDTVRKVFHWYVVGEDGEGLLSARAIALRCMDLGLRLSVGAKNHKCNDPSVVHTGTILRILRNGAYAGLITNDGERFETDKFHVPSLDGSGRMETVVPRDVWEEAQRILDGGDKTLRNRRAKLLTGIVLCPCCGRKMYAQPNSSPSRSIHCPYRCGRYRACFGEGYRTLKSEHLESWVRKHLAPLLAAEIVAMRAERTGEPARKEIAALERKSAALRSLETERLAEMIAAGMEASQVMAVGAKFSSERKDVERRLAELRLRERGEVARQHDPFDLLSESDAVVRTALIRAVRWITFTKWGLIVLTKSGAYIGAYYGRGDKRPRGGHRPPKLLPPSVAATRECVSWIRDREAFLEGARHIGGRWSKVPSDQELLPLQREDASTPEIVPAAIGAVSAWA
jgi:DNA invertase Pin-like site-specific DNA recombinase